MDVWTPSETAAADVEAGLPTDAASTVTLDSARSFMDILAPLA